MKPRFSMAFYSQMDGKTKCVNGILKQYLRNLVSADQGDWADYVGRPEFSCNVATHLATKGWSFVVVYRVDALQPTNLALEGAHPTKMVRTWPKSINKSRTWPNCWWRKPKSATKWKSMPEDANWSMRWAKTVLLNGKNFTLPEGLIPKFMSKIRASYLIVE